MVQVILIHDCILFHYASGNNSFISNSRKQGWFPIMRDFSGRDYKIGPASNSGIFNSLI